MKTCAERKSDLVELVFGALDDRMEAELNEHLLSCDTCRDEEQRLLALQASARAVADVAPFPAMRARVRAMLERERGTPGVGLALLRRPVPGYVAIATGLMGALLVAAFPDGNRPRADRSAEGQGAPPPTTAVSQDALPFTVAASSETRLGPGGVEMHAQPVPEDSL